MSTSSASSLYFGSDYSSTIKKKAGKPSSYWETVLSWLTNKEINIYMRLCMRCCIWVSCRGCVNRYVIPVPVCTHGTPPFLSECIFLTPQRNQSVFIHVKKKTLCMVPFEWLSACLLQEYGWSAVFHSRSQNSSQILLSLKGNHIISQQPYNH